MQSCIEQDASSSNYLLVLGSSVVVFDVNFSLYSRWSLLDLLVSFGAYLSLVLGLVLYKNSNSRPLRYIGF